MVPNYCCLLMDWFTKQLNSYKISYLILYSSDMIIWYFCGWFSRWYKLCIIIWSIFTTVQNFILGNNLEGSCSSTYSPSQEMLHRYVYLHSILYVSFFAKQTRLLYLSAVCWVFADWQRNIWGLWCQQQVSVAWTSNHIPHNTFDFAVKLRAHVIITCTCFWQQKSHIAQWTQNVV